MRSDLKLRAAALAVIAALALSACGGDSSSESNQSNEELISNIEKQLRKRRIG